jgi:hypothetical protein
MKNRIATIKKKLSMLTLFYLVFMIQSQKVSAQAFYNANNTDISSACGSNHVENTNNDYIESSATSDKRVVIVYDGSNPGLFWDDLNGHTGHVALGAGITNCHAVNPDVSLSSDGKWAIVVYQDDGNGDNIMAEVFNWISGTYSYSYFNIFTLYRGGLNAKIDGNRDNVNGEQWMVVWNKYTSDAVFTTAGYFDNVPQPYFDPSKNVLLQGNGSRYYSAPDVSILRDSVYYTYNEFDGTNNIFTVESQPWIYIKNGQHFTPVIYDLQYSNSNYAYDMPRISSFFNVYYGYYDWAAVAQTPNNSSGGTEIHGFVKHWSSAVNTTPYVYNNGSLAMGTPNDITRFQNNYPVISYVGDYIFILWKLIHPVIRF